MRRFRVILRGFKPLPPELERFRHACGDKDRSRKVDGRYPKCNRPRGHQPPHRLYGRATAELLREWA